MEFEKTVNLYQEYKSKGFIYSDSNSTIREDTELLNDLNLKNELPASFLFDIEFDEKEVYDLNLSTDKTNDLLRLCYLTKIQDCFDNEYKQYIKDEIYFYACSLKVYEKHYQERLNIFLNRYIDATEIDFIKSEYYLTHSDYENLPINLPNEYYSNKKYSLKKRNLFLENKMNNLGYEVVFYEEDISTFYDDYSNIQSKTYIRKKQKQNINNNASVKWKGTQTELIALIKALILSNKLDNSLTEKEISNLFEMFFDFELKNYSQTKSKFRNRTKDYTPFIDKLKFNLEQWIKEKDENK